MHNSSQQSKRGLTRLSLLASSILLAIYTPAYALQALDDTALSSVNGQDGLAVDVTYNRVDLDNVYWEDRTGTAANTETALRAYANNVSITGSNLGANIKVDTNSTGANPALDIDVSARLGTIAANSFNICDNLGSNCGASFGSVAIQSTDVTRFALSTTNGLFNQNGTADLTFALKNLNIYITQADAAIRNQLILKDFNFNFFGKGAVWIDATNGLQLVSERSGEYVDLLRVDDPEHAGKTKPGLNIELMYKGNVPLNELTTSNAQGVIRLGASGRVLNSKLVFRGTDARDAVDNILGFSFAGNNNSLVPDSTGRNATVVGSTGLALRMRADFVSSGSNEFTLEIGHAGNNAYGLEFGNLKPLLVRKVEGGALNPDAAYVDTGNVYFNLANTKRLQLPINTVLNNTQLVLNRDLTFTNLTSNSDYNQLVHNTAVNPNTLVTAVRGLEFQAISRRGRFLVSNDVLPTSSGYIDPEAGKSNTWGLGLPIYNLNTNIAVYGTTVTSTSGVGTAQRLGFSLGLTTQGVNTTGDKTTSILLIDGAPNLNDNGNPVSAYLGLRNIDLLVAAYGTIGLESGKINLKIPSLLVAASMQVASGYLPGAKYRTEPGFAPLDNFLKNTDVLFGLNLRLQGELDLNIIPGGNTFATNALGFQGMYNLTSGSVQIVDPINRSKLGLDNMSGRIQFNNAIQINQNSVDFDFGLTFNPNQTAADVFRVRDVNLHPFDENAQVYRPAQRLGELVITGGTLQSSLNIIPR